jgi:hypothetical protein
MVTQFADVMTHIQIPVQLLRPCSESVHDAMSIADAMEGR